MNKYKMLYKIMYDDLKDADMIIEYAEELCETEDSSNKSLADSFMKLAKERLDSFMVYHQRFVEAAKEEGTIKKESEKKVQECLWDLTHEHNEEWYHKLKKEIEEYK